MTTEDAPKCFKCGNVGIIFVGDRLLCGDHYKTHEKQFDNMILEVLDDC